MSGESPASGPFPLPVETAREPQALEAPLSQRQRKALRELLDQPSFSRKDYQDAGGSDVPQRTAQHDLQDLVSRGIVVKEGKGPATRYRIAEHRDGASSR